MAGEAAASDNEEDANAVAGGGGIVTAVLPDGKVMTASIDGGGAENAEA